MPDVLPPHTCFQIALEGEFDLAREGEMQELVDRFRAGDGVNVRVDLAAVTFMDSSLLAMLEHLHSEALQRGGYVEVTHADAHAAKLISLMGLGAILHVRPDVVAITQPRVLR